MNWRWGRLNWVTVIVQSCTVASSEHLAGQVQKGGLASLPIYERHPAEGKLRHMTNLKDRPAKSRRLSNEQN